MADVISSFTPFGLKPFVKAKLVPINTSGQKQFNIPDTAAEFYINPDSWSESKTATWVKHEVPGRSDPIQQWLSSGARTISFTALVTRDIYRPTDETPTSISSTPSGIGSSTVSKIGSIALAAAGLSDVMKILDAATPPSRDKLKLDISTKLDFYRSLLYPNLYGQGAKVYPPRPVYLIVGTTFGARTQKAMFVVDRVEIKILKQLADLTPIEAEVTFTLTELVDRNLASDINIFTGFTNG